MIRYTFTGVDERTDLLRLPPNAEIGVLYTYDGEGRHRYPSYIKATEILTDLQSLGYRAALHVCGRRARIGLLEGSIFHLTDLVQRIQVNGIVKDYELRFICNYYKNHRIITQHNRNNFRLLELDIPNHEILVDGSGGRGVSPTNWVRPETSIPVGFAGGLGPENISSGIWKIKKVARGDWWIDMEGRLRDADDWFDVDAAAKVADFLEGLE